jgi:acetyl esterase
MPLDPDIVALLKQMQDAGAPALETMTLEQARAAAGGLKRLQRPAQDVASVSEFAAISADGESVPVRVYRPMAATSSLLPMLVYAHGGGWFRCTLDQYDSPCRALANASGCLVVCVDYRLAPEHKFPVPLQDTYAVIRWASERAADLGGDANRLAIGGDSSGGNLAAAACLIARDRGPVIKHLLLLWPPLNHDYSTASYRDFATGYMLTRAAMQACWNYYLPTSETGADPLASPLRAASLSGLPRATVITAEFDPLRDDGEAFAARLAAAGITTRLVRLPGMIHACIHMDGVAPAARRVFDEAASALRQAFAAEETPEA